ncbi:MAG: hypothetical protein EON54_02600 [Alcaligenaceae bacterium]|nr:MAG: hypothetical protein EON54_02600 [Alcaligenaceae bacterium]
MKIAAFVSLLVLAVGTAHAQAIYPVGFRYQATTLAPGGSVKSCGIRFLGLGTTPRGSTKEIDVVDASIGVHSDGYSVVKAGYTIGDLTNPAAGQSRSTGARVQWVRVGDSAPMAANGKATPGDDKDFYLYVNPLENGFEALKGLLEGKRIRVAFDMGNSRELIFSGQTPLDEETKTQFIDCFRQLTTDSKK